MTSKFSILVVALILGACDQSIESDKPCRATAEGWVCIDMDAPVEDMNSVDVGVVPVDMSQPVADMPTIDMTTPPVDMPAPPPATNCIELRDRGAQTGTHSIAIGGRQVDVHCDMATDGGGWMLVARSSEGAGSGNFGWRTSAGSLANLGAPYSLGEANFPFTEMIVAARDQTLGIGDRAYKIAAPANFWASCENAVCGVAVQALAGPCNDISMLNQAGHNSSSDIYFFRDVPEFVPYGLFPGGFNTFYENCVGGDLHNRQGVIYVR